MLSRAAAPGAPPYSSSSTVAQPSYPASRKTWSTPGMSTFPRPRGWNPDGSRLSSFHEASARAWLEAPSVGYLA